MQIIAKTQAENQQPGKRQKIAGPRVRLPKFATQTSFSGTLKASVDAYLKTQPRHRLAPRSSCIKAGALVLLMVLEYANLVLLPHSTMSGIAQSVLLGALIALVGFNVMHEAAHGNFSARPGVNRLIALTMDLAGVSAALYKIKHTVFHHTYTNIDGIDGDISEAPVLRMSTRQPLRAFHRHQWIYALPLYSLITLSWIFFDDYFRMGTGKIGRVGFNRPQGKKMAGLVGLKLAHPALALLVPMFFHSWRSVLGAYLLIELTLGLILALVFQLAHLFEGTDFPVLVNSSPGSGPGSEKDDWMIHQLKTTADFAAENRLITFLLGGLNFQVEHHLFANVSYAHYPAIRKIVKEKCASHGVAYHEFGSLTGAFVSHMRLLNRLGRSEEQAGKIPAPLRWLRNIWRAMHLAYGLLFLIIRKGDYRVIYTVFRYVMEHPSYRLSMAMLMEQPDFAALVRERYNPTGEVDFARLKRLPPGTLGRVFADFMDRPMIKQLEDLPKARQTINPEIDYIRLRLRLTHDIHHVVTGFPATEIGEMGISAFYVAQIGSPLNSMLLAVGLIKCTVKAPHRLRELMDAIVEGWEMGQRTRRLFGAKWEEVFEVPVTELQQEYLRGKPSKLQWTLIEEPL